MSEAAEYVQDVPEDTEPLNEAAAAFVFLLQREEWMDLAACRPKSNKIFFPERGNNTRRAKSVCATCPVKAACASYAERTGSVGVWGGELHTLFTRSDTPPGLQETG